MGYFSNTKVADVTEPDRFTLVHNANFIRFSDKGNKKQNRPVSLRLEVKATAFPGTEEEQPITDTALAAITNIRIKESKTGYEYTIRGTYEKGMVNSHTFFIARQNDTIEGLPGKLTQEEALGVSARNLCACLRDKAFFRNNFDISVPVEIKSGSEQVKEGHVVDILSKGCGAQYDFSISYHCDFLKSTPLPEQNENICRLELKSVNRDSIDSGTGDFRIELDIYTDTGVFPGGSSLPVKERRGEYLVSMTKSYFGNEIWFDPNTLLSRKADYSTAFLENTGWVDAGTACDYRFVAKRMSGMLHEPFYYSDILYAINGYGYTLANNNLQEYVFDTIKREKIKPLTNRPVTTHTKGQKHYFNFILEDSLHSSESSLQKLPIGLLYRFKTQSGEYLAQEVAHMQTQDKFGIVNTIEAGLDKIMEIAAAQITGGEKQIGRVEVMLCCNGVEVSYPVTFEILPSRLHTVSDFVFLNRLGGWDSFGFGQINAYEFKSSTPVIYKTQQPGYKTYDQIRSVTQKNITEQYTARTLPVTLEVAEWLREMGASTAVYELSTKRYIVIDGFTQKYDPSDNLFEIEMKYHYTDSYNGNYSGE